MQPENWYDRMSIYEVALDGTLMMPYSTIIAKAYTDQVSALRFYLEYMSINKTHPYEYRATEDTVHLTPMIAKRKIKIAKYFVEKNIDFLLDSFTGTGIRINWKRYIKPAVEMTITLDQAFGMADVIIEYPQTNTGCYNWSPNTTPPVVGGPIAEEVIEEHPEVKELLKDSYEVEIHFEDEERTEEPIDEPEETLPQLPTDREYLLESIMLIVEKEANTHPVGKHCKVSKYVDRFWSKKSFNFVANVTDEIPLIVFNIDKMYRKLHATKTVAKQRIEEFAIELDNILNSTAWKIAVIDPLHIGLQPRETF